MATFADVPEQREAKRLLEAALADGPAHAYLFHGPAGVGKRVAAEALAGELLGDPRRVDARTHPDLQVIEALAPDVAWADGAVRFSVPLARDAQIQ